MGIFLRKATVIFLYYLLAVFVIGVLSSVILTVFIMIVGPHEGSLSHNLQVLTSKSSLELHLMNFLAVILGIHHGVNFVYRITLVDEQDISEVPWLVATPFLLFFILALLQHIVFGSVLNGLSLIIAFLATRYFLQLKFKTQH
jgi:hypothetical protein